MRDNEIIKMMDLEKVEKLKYGFRCYTADDIGNITGIRSDCSKLSDFSFLKELKYLKKLILIQNENMNIETLKEIKSLTFLYLSNNHLTDITPLKELLNLKYLNLSNNQITDVSPLKRLSNLWCLNLFNNQLTDISSLSELDNLNELYLDSNQISDISPLKNLMNLKFLNLRKNKIKELFDWIVNFNMEIFFDNGNKSGIFLDNNPLQKPPIEVIRQGKYAINKYFKEAKKGSDYIYEAKIMIVGEPGAGKTTLMNKLFDRNYPVPDTSQTSTLGIEVRQGWTFENEGKKYKINIWDFGGQQIQYTLHQFFLSPGCVYVLMVDKRKEMGNFDYWLNIINLLAKNSTVIVVMNEINLDNASTFDFDDSKYRKLFPELKLIKTSINFKKIDIRFNILLDLIQESIKCLEFIGKPLPKSWISIRNEIERKKIEYINLSVYSDICFKYEINDRETQNIILKTLYLIGVVLHFQNDIYLQDIIFLDFNWTVDAVYAVLTDNSIKDNKGNFNSSKLIKLWTEKGYSLNSHSNLLQLMLKDNFDICYELSGVKNEFIVPLLLPNIKPKYEWIKRENLRFRFLYPFMPEGIISRLIVRLNKYIKFGLEWKEGVVLKRENAEAQIIETKTVEQQTKIIDISLIGVPNDRKELLTLIREEMLEIQNSSFKNIKYYEMVPCNCHICKESTNAEFYEYDTLKDFLKDNEYKIQCRNSKKMVDIGELMDAIYIIPKGKNLKNFDKDGVNIENINILNSQVNIADEIKRIEEQNR